jgi:hypothetical protein
VAPNPRLQRTRAARSPLSRKPFGPSALLLASALSLVACATAQAPQQDELAVIDAALAADWSCVGIHDPTRLSLTRRTSLYGLQDLSAVDFFRWPVASDRDLNFKIPAGLPGQLRQANHRSIKVDSPVSLQRFGSDRRLRPVVVSRPAFAASGSAAVVAVAVLLGSTERVGCESGFLVYLEKHESSWRVEGYGGFWIT